MANISIFDLNPAGVGLFSDSESFINSMQDLSDNELANTRGGRRTRTRTRGRTRTGGRTRTRSRS